MNGINGLNYGKKKDRNELCEYFKSFISPEILIKFLDDIEKDKKFEKVCKETYPYKIGDFGESTDNDIEYDISNIIAMSYNYYVSILKYTEYSRDIPYLGNDAKFFKKILETYYYEAEFKCCLSPHEKVSQNSGIPILFTMLSLTRIIIGLFEKHKDQFEKIDSNYDALFRYNSLFDSVGFCQSTLNGLLFGDITSAKSSLRSLTETYFTYYAIRDNHSAILVYYKNMWCKICRLENRNLDKDQSNVNNVPRCPSSNKLDYGWLSVLLKTQKSRNFSFIDVFDFCFPKNPVVAHEWNRVYQACSNSIHGNQLYYQDKFLGIYDISFPLSTILLKVSNDFSSYVKLTTPESTSLHFLVDQLKKEKNELKKMMNLTNIIWMCDINKLESE